MTFQTTRFTAILLAILGMMIPGSVAAQTAPGEALAGLRPGPGAAALFPAQGELAAKAGVLESEGEREAAAPMRLQARPRGSVPLMAAGGTLLVAGAVIGGDAGTLLMVGGAGVLAWGVYLHF